MTLTIFSVTWILRKRDVTGLQQLGERKETGGGVSVAMSGGVLGIVSEPWSSALRRMTFRRSIHARVGCGAVECNILPRTVCVNHVYMTIYVT